MINHPSRNKDITISMSHEQKRVHFDEYDSIIPIQIPYDTSMGSNDNDDTSYQTWYRLEDLEQFREEARCLCLEMKYHDELVYLADHNNNIHSEDSDTSSSSSSTTQKVPTLARNSYTRGLEQRTCVERQRRKRLSNRFIVKVAPKLYKSDPNKLAEVAQKCNAWATDLAIEEASRDRQRVECDYDKVVSKSMDNNHINKRICTDLNDHQRKRVRLVR